MSSLVHRSDRREEPILKDTEPNNSKHSRENPITKQLKRIILVAIFLCLIILVWLGTQPNPSHKLVRVWTEQNTKYPKRESVIPPTAERVVLPRLSFDPTLMKLLDKEWTEAMRSSPIIAVDFEFNKGFSEKYRVVFETGHVAIAKPLISAEEAEAGLYQQLKTMDYDLIPENKRSGRRTGIVDMRLIQGWSEVAAFHVDRILEFYMKPPITVRNFDNHFWFSFDSSVRSLRYRNADTFSYPMAFVGWLDNVRSFTPDWDIIGKTLIAENITFETEHLDSLRSISDIIVFDFLIDDHDKHNVQNWKEWRTEYDVPHPLNWDSGLAWSHGPDGKEDVCYNLLCGPREWREMEPGWNDTYCRPICRFNSKTIYRLRNMNFGHEPSLGKQLEEALRTEPIYPIFEYGEFQAAHKSRGLGNIVHFKEKNFYDGMDEKVKRLLQHVDTCVEIYGESTVLL